MVWFLYYRLHCNGGKWNINKPRCLKIPSFRISQPLPVTNSEAERPCSCLDNSHHLLLFTNTSASLLNITHLLVAFLFVAEIFLTFCSMRKADYIEGACVLPWVGWCLRLFPGCWALPSIAQVHMWSVTFKQWGMNNLSLKVLSVRRMSTLKNWCGAGNLCAR